MRSAILLAILASASVAHAQSKRYPPDPVDRDAEVSKKSGLWEAATNPQRTPYDALLAETKQLLDDASAAGAKEAVAKLDDAVKLMPGESTAYRLRGQAHMTLKDWDRCASDYSATLLRLKANDVEVRSSAEIRRRLGICLAHAGKLAEAERVLAEAAASGMGSGEIWMRLGEVRIAMGKLEEAISALESARDAGGEVPQAIVKLLLAGAYDRARRPAEAAAAAADAAQKERDLATTVRNSPVPLLGVGESEYLLGLAAGMHDPPRPEHALVYFRRFLKLATDSPWRKRAEEHVKELRTADLPETIERGLSYPSGPWFEAQQMRPPVRKVMPAMRACLAKTGNVAFRVELTKVGPKGTTRRFTPPEAATVLPDENPEQVSKTDLDTATRCIQPIAERLIQTLPAIREKDAWYKFKFFVVSP